jgi:hypothetical protein
LYAAANRWENEDSLHDCTLTITELVAAGPAAGAALWGELLPDNAGRWHLPCPGIRLLGAR